MDDQTEFPEDAERAQLAQRADSARCGRGDRRYLPARLRADFDARYREIALF